MLSIIIPTFNRVEILPRAIDSVLMQDFKDFQLIIIDDGSEDQTFDMVRSKYEGVEIYRQENAGASSARNFGVRKAKGEYIAFLDSDDEFLKDKLSRQVCYMKKNPEYKLCHTEEIWMKNGVRVNPMKKHQKLGGNIFENSLKLCSISMSTVMVRKELFDEIGYFDESLPACEDYDFWLRVTSRYPVLFLNEFLTRKYGGHEDQLSMKYYGMDRFRIKSMQNLLSENILNEDKALKLKAILKNKLEIFIKGAKKHGNLEEMKEFKNIYNKIF